MDDSRLQFGRQSCSVVLVIRCRSIKKCPILARLQTLSLGKMKRLVHGYLTNFMVLEVVLRCVVSHANNNLRLLNFEGSVSIRKW